MRRLPLVRARMAALAMVAALPLTASCGDEQPLPHACLQARSDDVLRALRGAPGDVTLADGTLLSTCVDRAIDDAELQTIAVAFIAAADELAGRVAHSDTAAFRLGFLIGATERGAGPTGGTQGELVRRLKEGVSFRVGSAARQAEVLRGEAAGRSDG